MSETWNPWHGCKRISSGCLSCPVYQKDYRYGRNPSLVFRTKAFDLPVQKNRTQTFRLSPEDHLVKTCTTSDIFIEEADAWRSEAWRYIHSRPDLDFLIITKRPERIAQALPSDWDDGYENVSIGVSVESQYNADRRIRLLLSLPVRKLSVAVEPMLGPVHLSRYLATGKIDSVSCGGESGPYARICDFAWVLDLMLECVRYGVPFRYTQTGGRLKKGDQIYNIGEEYQITQAEKAGINFGEVIAV